jgi:cysteinyl-tRNA synthetase
LRFAMLRTHYRQPLGWTERAVEESERALLRFAQTAADTPASEPSQELLAALADDLNTPAAIAHLHNLEKKARDATSSEAAEAAAQLARDAQFLGLDLAATAKRLAEATGLDAETKSRVEALVAERLASRRAKEWAASDRLREELESLGVTLKDSKDGTTWELRR